jgi:hypothetical protein
MSYSFSFGWLIVIAIYFFYLRRLITHIKNQHPEIYDSFGGKRVWYSAPDQIKFFGWLFKQKHNNLNDPTLSKLAIVTQLLLIIGVVFMFTAPLTIQSAG